MIIQPFAVPGKKKRNLTFLRFKITQGYSHTTEMNAKETPYFDVRQQRSSIECNCTQVGNNRQRVRFRLV